MPQTVRERRASREQRDPVRTSKDEIQEAAIQLFLRKGYHGTSTTDICQALGISRPTLYWYFKDKEDLLFSLHKQRIEESLKPLIAAVRREVDPLKRIGKFIDGLAELICTEREVKILIKETEYLDPEHRDWVAAVWKDQFEMLRDTIGELKQTGKAKDVSETFMAFSLLGMITWAYNWFDYARPQGIARLQENIREVFLRGLLDPTAVPTPLP